MEKQPTKTCGICQIVLPIMTDNDEKHNFSHLLVDGKIVDVCINCKMKKKPDVSPIVVTYKSGGWC